MFSPAGGIFFANKMRTKGYVTMLDPLQVIDLFMLLIEVKIVQRSDYSQRSESSQKSENSLKSDLKR